MVKPFLLRVFLLSCWKNERVGGAGRRHVIFHPWIFNSDQVCQFLCDNRKSSFVTIDSGNPHPLDELIFQPARLVPAPCWPARCGGSVTQERDPAAAQTSEQREVKRRYKELLQNQVKGDQRGLGLD